MHVDITQKVRLLNNVCVGSVHPTPLKSGCGTPACASGDGQTTGLGPCPGSVCLRRMRLPVGEGLSPERDVDAELPTTEVSHLAAGLHVSVQKLGRPPVGESRFASEDGVSPATLCDGSPKNGEGRGSSKAECLPSTFAFHHLGLVHNVTSVNNHSDRDTSKW